MLRGYRLVLVDHPNVSDHRGSDWNGIIQSFKHQTHPAGKIVKSLEGNWRPELLFVLKQEVKMYDIYQQRIAECSAGRRVAALKLQIDEAILLWVGDRRLDGALDMPAAKMRGAVFAF